jgi:hypothetical protein
VAAAGVDGRCAARVSPWLLWLDRPAAADSPDVSAPGARVVLSPNHVDAWLGMGGTLLADADRLSTAVIACFGSVGSSSINHVSDTGGGNAGLSRRSPPGRPARRRSRHDVGPS